MAAVQTGAVAKVRIRRLLPYGLLVDLEDGSVGIIREREIAWDAKHRQCWRERYKPGDVVEAVVLGSRSSDRLELSLRLVDSDPWIGLGERYYSGQWLDGVITGIEPYGVFVELEPGVTGLLHMSKLPPWAKGPLNDFFWPGDHVRVMIEALDENRRRISLSIIDLASHRWPGPMHQSRPPQAASAVKSDDAPSFRKPPLAVPRLPLELLLEHGPRSVLIIEDDSAQLQAVADWLSHAGQHVIRAESGEKALALVADFVPDLALIDLHLPGINGIQVIDGLRHNYPNLHCVLMTDWSRAEEHRAEIETLATLGVRLLLKPFLPEELLEVLDAPERVPAAADAKSISPALASGEFRAVPRQDMGSVPELLSQLRRLTAASKVVLFELDPEQRKVNILAESGRDVLQRKAIGNLIHSPVRDVAEDRLEISARDVNQMVGGRFQYLSPLLMFSSCIGVPIPANLPQRFALFLFYPRPDACADVHQLAARAAALALGALLDRQRFLTQAADLQHLALLGQLTRSLVHEVNHRLGPINFALESLQQQCNYVERLATTRPDHVEAELRRAGDILAQLAAAARALTSTARLFGQMARSEAGRAAQILLLKDTMQEVVDIMRDRADRAGITLEVVPPPHLMFTRGQVTAFQQITLNLVLNAIQQIEETYGKRGGRVCIRFEEITPQGNQLRILVEDDGPGIHRRLWERIFELGFTTRDEGSGLGLYITRGLAESMGGKVYVAKSLRLWGTTFVVELPFQI